MVPSVDLLDDHRRKMFLCNSKQVVPVLDTKPSFSKTDFDYVSAIVDTIYDSFSDMYFDASYLVQCVVVCPTNKVVDSINDTVFSKVPGEAMVFKSCDTICKLMYHVVDGDMLYPPEFHHNVDPPDFRHHKISLKVGVPIMLLGNINHSIGLCNGTRLMVTRLGEWVLEVKITTGSNIGERVCIPRIVLNPPATKCPSHCKACSTQSVCATPWLLIKVKDRQTLNKVGVYLPKPAFSHGQSYVVVSRLTLREGLRVLALDESGVLTRETRNMVYQEVRGHL